MKTVILAGGLGTRLMEETVARPKPMVEVGGKPMLWHIMSLYAGHGFRDFTVALGYKGDLIKRYFLDFYALQHDLTVDLGTGAIETHENQPTPWRVDLVDTGQATQTGGRLLRLRSRLHGERFMLTYGDGLADLDLHELVRFHVRHGKLATLTAVRPPSRFGSLSFEGDRVARFIEKPQAGEGWINGGFFVFESGIFDYLTGDETPLEWGPLERLSSDGQLMAYQHPGFWQAMDTVRDRQILEELWASGKAPWRIEPQWAISGMAA